MIKDNLAVPLVSCIMPTYNRRAFLPHAIRYFLQQDYPHKELIIVDDGTDNIKDLIPKTDQIKYIRFEKKITLGEKRNFCVQESEGELIMHWDDDDWYSSKRLKYQVEIMLKQGTDICGINKLLYLDLCNKNAYQYIYPPNQRIWLAGSSMCYTRGLWNHNKFAEINIGEDGLFVWKISSDRITVLSDSTIAVHMIHKHNGSQKKTNGGWWHAYSVEEIRKILNTDWIHYVSGSLNEI